MEGKEVLRMHSQIQGFEHNRNRARKRRSTCKPKTSQLNSELGTRAFSHFRSREREAKKSAGAGRKTSAIKEKALSAKLKAQIRAFSLPLPRRTGNPVPEPKSTRQKEKQGAKVTV
jgi:hypothetical protein